MTEVEGIEMTDAAACCAEESGCSPRDDLDAIDEGRWTRATLLGHCLDGAAPDRQQGWRDYVDALAALRPGWR